MKAPADPTAPDAPDRAPDAAPPAAPRAAALAAVPRIEAALRAERLRLYREGKWAGIAGQVVIGVLVLWVVHAHVAASMQWLWAGLVLAALAARAACDLPRREPGAVRGAVAELWRTRAAVFGAGATLGLAGALLFPSAQFEAQVFLGFMMAGLAAGALTLTSFDLRTALAYALVVLLPLALRLLVSGGPPAVGAGAAALLFVGFLALNGLRAQRNMRLTLAVRETDAQRTELLLESQRRLEQATAEMRRASQELRLTFEHMDEGIFSLGPDGRTLFFNRRMCELTGVPETFMAQRPLRSELLEFQRSHGHFDEGRQPPEEPVPRQYFRRTHLGTVLDVRTAPLPGGGFVRTYADVTALFEINQRLRDSEAQQRKLALVASHTDDAVIITDAERRIEWVNEAFMRLTGYAPGEVTGRRTAEFLRGPATDAQTARRLERAEQLSRKASGEILHYRKDGSSYWFALETRVVHGEDGRVQHYIGIGRDVTARREAEAALRAARDEAERASRAKSDFLSAMSHELRTPLNAILGFAQLLEADAREPLAQRQREQVRRIREAGAHLLGLINDVLDLARVEAGREVIRLEPVALLPLVDECLVLTRPLAADRRIEVGAALPASLAAVHADRMRLKQVLLNLLANAVKYNRPEGRVQVHASAVGGQVRLVVADTGPGLDARARERLFTAFERLGAEHGPVEGAGIGLALSRRLLALMHGTIEAASEPGEGSRFTVTLPAAGAGADAGAGVQADAGTEAAPTDAPAASAPLPGPAAQAALAQPDAPDAPDAPDGQAGSEPTHAPCTGPRAGTVLYIEDNPVNLVLMQSMLEPLPGLRLLVAERAEPGLALALAERPDLILMDIQLPGIDGYEALRRLRADARTCAIPVVAISANAMHGDIERGLAAGFDDYLTKPLDVATLRAAVRQRLEAARS